MHDARKSAGAEWTYVIDAWPDRESDNPKGERLARGIRRAKARSEKRASLVSRQLKLFQVDFSAPSIKGIKSMESAWMRANMKFRYWVKVPAASYPIHLKKQGTE
jgi:hypothetical protein